MDIAARRFNDAFTYRWGRVIDFPEDALCALEAQRFEYWRDNVRAETIPDRLSEQLTLWRHQPPSRYDFFRVEEVFPLGELPVRAVWHGLPPRPAARITTIRRPRPSRWLLSRSCRDDWQDARSVTDQPRPHRAHQAHGLPRI
jgi:hypothetical protein